MIELIFVMVIIGILSFVGFTYIPKNNKLIADTQVLKGLILERKSNAIGFRADMNSDDEKNVVCITFDKDTLNNEESTKKTPYVFKSDINATSNGNSIEKVCFDDIGRVHCGEIREDLSSICHQNVIITLSLHGREKNITISSYTGAVY